jgi:polyisoprenoid-binding protein YceI
MIVMKYGVYLACVGLTMAVAGCTDATSPSGGASPATASPVGEASVSGGEGAAITDSTDSGPPLAAVIAEGDRVEINPSNTAIQFVGNHTGDDPKPRRGRFEQFQGTIGLQGGKPNSIEVVIDTASLKTEIDKLTNHLKNADFFDVKQFPQAKFQSTEVEDDGEGIFRITGDLTLLDKTNSVTFFAAVSTDERLTIEASFEIDRTRWGMDYGLDQIEKQVPLTIVVGG